MEPTSTHATPASGDLGGLARGLPPDSAVQVVELARHYDAQSRRTRSGLISSLTPQGAAARRRDEDEKAS